MNQNQKSTINDNEMKKIVEIDVASNEKRKLSFLGYKAKIVIMIILTIYFDVTLLGLGFIFLKKDLLWLILIAIIFVFFNIFMIITFVHMIKRHRNRFIVKGNSFEDVLSNLNCPNYVVKERIIESFDPDEDEDFDYSSIESEEVAVKEVFDLLDLKKVCSDFVLFAETKGLHVDFSSVRDFFSAMSSTNLIIINNKKLTLVKKFIDVVSEFLGTEASYIKQGSNWENPSDLYFKKSNNHTVESSFTKSIINSKKNPNSFGFSCIAGVTFTRFLNYFKEILPFVIHPNRTTNIQLDSKVVLSKNNWFILILDENVNSIPTEVALNTSIVNLVAYDIDNKENDYQLEEIYYPQFERVIKNDEEIYINESSWKKFDELVNEFAEVFKVEISNKYFCELESFATTYYMCGGSELEAIDHMVSSKFLPYIVANKKLFPVEIDNIRKHIDDIFGTEEMLSTKQLLSKMKELN